VKFVRFLLVLLWLLIAAAIVFWWWQGRLERSQDRPILAAARRYSVDPALVKAIVWRESYFHPNARGRSKEIGLMQLQEEAAQQWADAEKLPLFVHEHCLDPVTNTLAGTFYLKQLLRRYERTDNPIPYALADYNAGRGNVLKWIQGAAATNSALFQQQIGFPGTSNYVKAVMKRHQHYRETWRQSPP
jgi:soluble lytic murein transglycosylase